MTKIKMKQGNNKLIFLAIFAAAIFLFSVNFCLAQGCEKFVNKDSIPGHIIVCEGGKFGKGAVTILDDCSPSGTSSLKLTANAVDIPGEIEYWWGEAVRISKDFWAKVEAWEAKCNEQNAKYAREWYSEYGTPMIQYKPAIEILRWENIKKAAYPKAQITALPAKKYNGDKLYFEVWYQKPDGTWVLWKDDWVVVINQNDKGTQEYVSKLYTFESLPDEFFGTNGVAGKIALAARIDSGTQAGVTLTYGEPDKKNDFGSPAETYFEARSYLPGGHGDITHPTVWVYKYQTMEKREGFQGKLWGLTWVSYKFE